MSTSLPWVLPMTPHGAHATQTMSHMHVVPGWAQSRNGCPRDVRTMFGQHCYCTTAIAPNSSPFVSIQRINVRTLVPQEALIAVLGGTSGVDAVRMAEQNGKPRLHGPLP